jgi:hypothetical protein
MLKKTLAIFLFIGLLILANFAFTSYSGKKTLELELQGKQIENDLYLDELANKQLMVLDRNTQIEELQSEVDALSVRVANFEEIERNRVCTAITFSEFDYRVRIGTNFVITPEKMRWPGYWTIRDNVLFDNPNELARGYEFRIDLTPQNYSDELQEFHTTIRAFHTPDAAQTFYEKKGDLESKSFVSSEVDFVIPIKIWANSASDVEKTITLSFTCDIYQADLKIKYLEDTDLALEILEQAAILTFADLSIWVP